MNVKKKLLGVLIALTLFWGIMTCLGATSVKAADDGNDFYEKAVKISADKKVTDYLESTADHDWFKYTIAKGAIGTVRFKLERNEADAGCWSFRLYVLEDDKLIKLEDKYGSTYTSELYSYASGTEMYLEVFYADYRNNTITKKYNVSVALNADPPEGCIWAKENDNNFEKGNKLSNDNTLVGLLNTTADTDWYTYTTKGTNDVRFKIDRIDANKGVWSVAIYELVDDNLVCIESTNKASSWITSHRTFISGTQLFIKVYYYDYNGNTINTPYRLSVSCKEDPIEGYKLASETKDNAPVKLTSANPMVGILNNTSDSDWFVYTVQSQDVFKFKFGQAVGDTGKWSYAIYKENDEENLENLYSSIKVTNYTSDEFSFKKGTKIYLKVFYSDYNGNTTNEFYTIKAIDSVKNTSTEKDSETKSDNDKELEVPYSILSGTNVVVGKAAPGSEVYVEYKNKKYHSTADSNGIYRIKTAKLTSGKSVKMWTKSGKTTSSKITVKVINKY